LPHNPLLGEGVYRNISPGSAEFMGYLYRLAFEDNGSVFPRDELSTLPLPGLNLLKKIGEGAI